MEVRTAEMNVISASMVVPWGRARMGLVFMVISLWSVA